jgi:hypothetical protein
MSDHWVGKGYGTPTSAGWSRRQLFKVGTGVVGGVALGGFAVVAPAEAKPSFEPKPIPGGFDENFNMVPSGALFHVLPPAVGLEMSTITDFNGVVGGADIGGTASGSDGSKYSFDADMRFMRGRYIATDGRLRDGAFAFV